ncbi:hypothetical protein TUM4438_23730 [Shewanella sairae]|uniref:Uncharacterized protein n=1 Tax=Shewanella sairae TaxID=190310 RepID=A0ABQ4PHE5_9GAMM|nr:hypothetical protein [Shewanella sairae]MCL1130617.1 hypothetical protein [Shewanella sairae]GIU46817.1 hypothetical protein TUM4438_23730 [Shewanella sairae]
MHFIPKFLYISAIMLLLYPLWGMLSPSSFLTELIEDYPNVLEAAASQVRVVALLFFIENGILATALFSLGQFISNSKDFGKLKTAGLLLLLYPVVKTVINTLGGIVLYIHLTETALIIELSTQTLFYGVMGLALIGISSSAKKAK